MKNMISSILIGLLIVNMIFISSAIGNEELIDKKMVKVYVESQDDVDTLSNLGLEIYVIEQNYLAIRITNEEEQELERIGFSVTSIKEDELVHRIVKVVINQEDINELANLGLDIWEVNPGYLIAMVYDKHIIEIKEKGFVVEILYKSEKDFQESVFGPVQAISQAGVSYHSYSSLKTDLQNLENNYPNIAKVYDIGDSWEKTQGIAGRDILAIKISDNVANEDDDEPDILFMGGTHAREWISVEVPFYLAKYLIEHYSTDQKVKQLVDSKEIWIVPLVNPDGLEYSRTDNRLWRKNRRDNGDGTFGVDPNRNFGYKWGQQGSSGDPASDTYRGTAPFSEPETQAIRNLESKHDFSSSISYHSYSQLVLYPWGYTKDAPPHKVQLSKMAEYMATEIKKIHGKTYTPEQASDLYIVSGDSDDWLYGVHNIAAFTIELRPKNPWDNWFKPFELPEDQIIPTWEENKPAALYLIEWFQELDIKSPTEASPASAGAFDNPGHIEITVEVKDIKGPMTGYSATDFSFKIGGKEAIASLIDTSIPGKYVFDVTPPTQVAAGKYDLEVEVICAGSSSKDTEQEAVEYTSGNVDVMLIIDRSGSMGGEIGDARNAAKLFIDYMRDNDKAGVVSFSSYAGYNYHLTTLTPSVKTAIKNAINRIYASGMTAMGRGLRYGLNDLTSRGDSTHPWAMVLLSDGYHNTGEHPNNVLPAIRNANIKVFTIGLGSYVDTNLLRSIATNSGAGGGKYYHAPSSSDLQEIYDLIVGMVTGQQTSYSTTGTILPAQTSSLTLPITSSTTSATFSISWGGSDLDLVLYKPDGTEINPSVAATDPNVDYVEESTYEFYRVANPDAGVWTMEITAISVPTGGEDYTAKVRVASTLTISLSTDKDQYNQGETLKTTVSLTEDGSPLTGATVSTDITLPDGSTESFTLYDDGGHGDTAANDGVFANYFANTLQTGDHTVDVSATGTTSTGEQFSREDQCTFKVVAGPSLITLIPDTWIDTVNTGEQIQSTFTLNDPAKIGELFPLDESTYAEYNGTHYLVYNESSIGGEPDSIIPAPPSSESLADASTVGTDKIAISPSVTTNQLSSNQVSKWVSLTATSLQTPTGDIIGVSNIIISPNVLEVPLGGSKDFDVNISIPSDAVGGTYTGKIVASAITGSDSIDLEITVISNLPPIADANGPYTGFVGEPITLNGTGSYDPDGTIVNYEWDLDDDGVFNDTTGATPTITFAEYYSGNIHLKVTDDNGATDIDTTTLTVLIPATIDFDPDTLNKKSNGKWVTAYTELLEGYNVTDINVSTMMLNEIVPAELKPTEVGDYDSDGILDLMVKFDWQAVSDILPIGDTVDITVTGELYNGSLFEGSDTIRIIDEG